MPIGTISFVEQLDLDGMSSEESDGEIGGDREFLIKRLPWRSAQVTAWLHKVDKLPTKNSNNEVLTRRATYRKRIEADIESVNRRPVPCLPKNMYSQTWLQAQGERACKKLGVKDVSISLPKP
jgi:hypothetical protein